jgi:DNA-binding NtrC family response regulator
MNRKKILVVDSPTRTRRLLVDKLVEQGHEVSTAGSVHIGTQFLRNSNFDLVITEGSVSPTGSADDGVEWVMSICETIPVVVFSLVKYSFPKHGILYFDKILGYQPLLDYVSKM